ncbi:hypothetical protein ES703_07545 [subsurface metagenome]
MPKFDELKFEPVIDPNLFAVTRCYTQYLFDQIPHRDWEVDSLYDCLPLFVANPLNRFWALTDIASKIKGFLWITIDPVVGMIAVNILTVDREYQNVNGSLSKTPSEIVKKVVEHLHKFQDELKAKGGIELKRKIFWSTARPKAFERAGAKRHNRIIMEI